MSNYRTLLSIRQKPFCQSINSDSIPSLQHIWLAVRPTEPPVYQVPMTKVAWSPRYHPIFHACEITTSGAPNMPPAQPNGVQGIYAMGMGTPTLS